MNLQKNIYRRNNNGLFESKNIIYIYFNNAIHYRNSFSNYFIGEIKMELTKRQKEVLEDVLWKECKELINLIHSGSSSCLLYTSPSPRDGLLSRMPSSA